MAHLRLSHPISALVYCPSPTLRIQLIPTPIAHRHSFCSPAASRMRHSQHMPLRLGTLGSRHRGPHLLREITWTAPMSLSSFTPLQPPQACSRFAAARPATAPPLLPFQHTRKKFQTKHPAASKHLGKRRIYAGLANGPFLPTPRRLRALPLVVSCAKRTRSRHTWP